VAIEVSGCHLVLVMLRLVAAAARQGRAATARVTCPSLTIWAGSLPESHSRGTAQTGIAGAARP